MDYDKIYINAEMVKKMLTNILDEVTERDFCCLTLKQRAYIVDEALKQLIKKSGIDMELLQKKVKDIFLEV